MKGFIKAYQLLFYKIYSWGLKMHGKEDIPEYNAVFGISFLVFMNILSISGLTELIFGREVVTYSTTIPRWTIAMFLIFLFVINYMIFIHKGKYKKMAKDFNKENDKTKLISTVIVWVYIIFSIIALFGPWIILVDNRS
ncbi:MAG TPA: hypothetical protein ENJ95_21205 [Bacteroidetes bacterium]|nr:hypothetical protein [Bacteroidota bacterium]